MAFRLYIDHHVHEYVVDYLRRQGIDCLTAHEDGRAAKPDESLLERATELQRIIVTFDKDFHVLHARWVRAGRSHHGIIKVRPNDGTPNKIMSDIALIALASTAEEVASNLFNVPM